MKSKALTITMILVYILTMSPLTFAATPATYELRVGVENNDYVTKQVFGVKKTVEGKDFIVETDAAGNYQDKAYVSGQVIGDITTESVEKVEVDDQMDWDKVHQVQPLNVDFWFPNIRTGVGVNTDYSTRDVATDRAGSGYYIKSGAPTTFIAESNANTWMLIAIVNNPNSFKIKGTISLNLSTFYFADNTMDGLTYSKTLLFRPGISYVNCGNIEEKDGKKRKVALLQKDSGTFEGGYWRQGSSAAIISSQIEDIFSPLYSDTLRTKNGKLGGFKPLGSWQPGTTAGNAIPVFTENGGMRLQYNLHVSGCLGADYWSSKSKYFTDITGTVKWDTDKNDWVIAVNEPYTNIQDYPSYYTREYIETFKKQQKKYAEQALNELFSGKTFKDMPPVTSYFDRDPPTHKINSNGGWVQFKLFWPTPVGVMNQPANSYIPLNFAGWHYTAGNASSYNGDMWEPLYAGNIHTSYPGCQYVSYDTIENCGERQQLISGSYWQAGAYNNYQPTGWMQSLPVVKTYPCFIDTYEFVPDPNADSPDIGYLIKNSVVGVSVHGSSIMRPYINWTTELSSIEVTDGSNKCVWSPSGGWDGPQTFTRPVEIKINTRNTLEAINNSDYQLSFNGTYGHSLKFIHPYLLQSKGLNNDDPRTYQLIRNNADTILKNKFSNSNNIVFKSGNDVLDTGLTSIDMPTGTTTVCQQDKTSLVFTSPGGNYSIATLNNIQSACSAALSTYTTEAIFADRNVIMLLPERDFTKWGNIAYGGAKTLIMQRRGSRSWNPVTQMLAFPGAPTWVTSTSIIQKDFPVEKLSNGMLQGDRTWNFGYTYGLLPWRVFTGQAVNLPDPVNW